MRSTMPLNSARCCCRYSPIAARQTTVTPDTSRARGQIDPTVVWNRVIAAETLESPKNRTSTAVYTAANTVRISASASSSNGMRRWPLRMLTGISLLRRDVVGCPSLPTNQPSDTMPPCPMSIETEAAATGSLRDETRYFIRAVLYSLMSTRVFKVSSRSLSCDRLLDANALLQGSSVAGMSNVQLIGPARLDQRLTRRWFAHCRAANSIPASKRSQ